MEIRLLKPAQTELDDGIVWYEEQVSGLGVEFLPQISNRYFTESFVTNSNPIS